MADASSDESHFQAKFRLDPPFGELLVQRRGGVMSGYGRFSTTKAINAGMLFKMDSHPGQCKNKWSIATFFSKMLSSMSAATVVTKRYCQYLRSY